MPPASPSRSTNLAALLSDLGGKVRLGEAVEACSAPSQRQPTGIPDVDRLLEGGFPSGHLSEIAGPASSGRTSLALALLASTTQAGACAALVDGADAFDPASAEALGVVLERVLWARSLGQREALRCAERLLETEGFPLVVLDLTEQRLDLPAACWIRLSRLAAGSGSALVLLSSERVAGPRAEVALEMQPARARFTGAPALLEELETEAVLVRHRSASRLRRARLRLEASSSEPRASPGAGFEAKSSA